jgi:hypothetical protein
MDALIEQEEKPPSEIPLPKAVRQYSRWRTWYARHLGYVEHRTERLILGYPSIKRSRWGGFS